MSNHNMLSNALNDQQTIAAIATARGHAGVAVIRVSGPQAWEIAWEIFSRRDIVFQHGRFFHGWILNEHDHVLDEALLLTFRAPHSYTGEDVVEIQCHGGDLLSHKILDLIIRQGARQALPGEFTKRAFLNGKLDLTQAESVMDLISARSERMLAQAGANLRNRSLGAYIDALSRKLLDLQSKIVASIDFPDEVDEPDRVTVAEKLEACLTEIARLRESAKRNRLVREGVKVAILGMPNSGKSSLFNALLAMERSIVTEEAGTTRDVVTESLELDGIQVTLVDTAGIRETRHSIEMMGIERSWQAANEAQVVLYLVDMSAGLLRYDTQIIAKLDPATTILLGNKTDLSTNKKVYPGWIATSTKTGEGLDVLLQHLREKIRETVQEETGLGLSLNQRQIACCEAIAECLQQAHETIASPGIPLDLVTVPLTDALRKLDELLGRDTGEEVLTQVFQDFCVGK